MSKSGWTPLKGLMWQRGAKLKDLQEVTGRGQTYVCVRLCGHRPWTMKDIQRISALLGIQESDWAYYFAWEGAKV